MQAGRLLRRHPGRLLEGEAAALGEPIILVLIVSFVLTFVLILVINQLFPGLPQPFQELQGELLLQGGNIQVTVLPS